ncbi:hypothetical protein G9A89_013790 [Geosiphon pyriformis]|nr:hypothetical protein G9A89_013790 [Geosiphon pyriformis]
MARGSRDLEIEWNRDWVPDTDAYLVEDVFIVKCDLPGLAKEDLHLKLNSKGNLVLSGQRNRDNKFEGNQCVCSERRYGRFCREIPVPTNADIEKMRAKFEEGVLYIEVPQKWVETYRIEIT